MSAWSLPQLFENIHNDIDHRLSTVRRSVAHPGSKGDGSESVWLGLLKTYLPQRYQCDSAFIVDSEGHFSEQQDVVIFDRQYSPFVFHYENQKIIPAESVYAVFEVKQTLNAANVTYAQRKIESVRTLVRTSLPIPHAGGLYAPKPLIPIVGGILALESDWRPALGKPLQDKLQENTENGLLNCGCVASQGFFFYTSEGGYSFQSEHKAVVSWLFKLLEKLQFSGTVPMINVMAYAEWISRECPVEHPPGE